MATINETLQPVLDHPIEEMEETTTLTNDVPAVVEGKKGCLETNNLRALWGMFILNTLFAIAQMVGAVIANSLSMFSDSGSMLVDSFAYMVNILLERKKHQLGPRATKLWEVYTSVFSVGLLVSVTVFAIVDATVRLRNAGHDNNNDVSVNGRYVFGFAAGNLLVDIAMCFNYCYQLRHRRNLTLKDELYRETKDELNMISAFVHLFADTLRTLTSIVAGVLEEQMEDKAVSIDSIATFIVCAAILAAASFVFYEACIQYREYHVSRIIGVSGQSSAPTTYEELS